jgi:hypothetical protein
MPLPDTAKDHYRSQQRLTMEVLAYAEEVWGSRPPADFDAWFAANVDALVQIMSVGQVRAVEGTDEYVSGTLDELGTPVASESDVVPESFSGVASDGRSLEGLLYGAVVTAGKQVGTKGPSAAWGMGLQALQVYMQTQLADASRVATNVAVTARPNAGYVRMLNPPSCSRCAVLAGRWYRWNAAFRRHPGCDCRAVPSLADAASDIMVDPVKYFDSLSVAEQNKTFTLAGAEAIRSGADIGQVVNVRRGATGLDSAAGSTGSLQTQDVYGQQLFTSTEGVTKRGVAGKVIRARGRNPATTPRLMPESIMELAESRADALRLLRLNGYVLDRSGPVSGAGSRTGLVPDIAKPVRPVIDLDAVAAAEAAKRAAFQQNVDDTKSWLAAESKYTADVTALLSAEKTYKAAQPTRVFTDDEGHDFGFKVWHEYADGLDAQQRAMILEYTGNGYRAINSGLRGDGTYAPGSFVNITDPVERTKLLENVSELDTVIDAAPRIPENIRVSRMVEERVFGISRDDSLRTAQASSLIGDVKRDDGFMSTSMESSSSFGNTGELQLVLDVPEGTQALYVSSHERLANGKADPKGLAAYGPEENELVLGRGVEYEITGMAENGRHLILYARVVGQKPDRIGG